MSIITGAAQHTPPSWCFTGFFWHSSHTGPGGLFVPRGTRTGLLPIRTKLEPISTAAKSTSSPSPLPRLIKRDTALDAGSIISVKTVVVVHTTLSLPPRTPTPTPTTFLQVRQNNPHSTLCYPWNINSFASAGDCPFGWTFAVTVSSTQFCCPFGFQYAETRTLGASSFFITTRCTSTSGSGAFHPEVTVTVEYDTYGQISDWITDGTMPALLDKTATTWMNLYAEATPYRILSPAAESDKPDLNPTSDNKTAINAPGSQLPTPGAEPRSTMSPGALAGIAIGAVLLLAAAVFFLWRRRLRKLKSEQQPTADDDISGGGPGLEVDEEAATKKPPPYELDSPQPAVFPVEADHGQKHGHEHELPAVLGFAAGSGPQELHGTGVVRELPGEGRAPTDSGQGQSQLVTPEMGSGGFSNQLSPATTLAMSFDSRPSSVQPEGDVSRGIA